MSKIAKPDHPIHDLITHRYSPYGFSSRRVSDEDLRSLLEAARWAPSSYNEQPWRFLVATKDNPREFQRILSCLVEGNQEWAQHAWVLVLTVASLRFSRNQKPNRVAVHDIGLAAAHLTFEATAHGLAVHQMAGILPDRAREEFAIPEGFEATTGIAVGYAATGDELAGKWRERDTAPRTRKPLGEIVFTGRFGTPAPFVG